MNSIRMIRTTAVLLGLGLVLCAAVQAGDRDVATAYLTSAEKSYKAGDYATARSMCERTLQADDAFPAAHLLMGQILEAQNQALDAIKSYTTAAELAKKEGNAQVSSKALELARKLGPGLVELAQADQKLADKLLALGDRALADEQYDTARQAFGAALAVVPDLAKARSGLQQADDAIQARGDPVKARIVAAAMSEVWYYMGIGNKEKARKMASDVAAKIGDMAAGKDAARLLANNFDLSKNIGQELASAKQELVEKQKKLAAKPAPPPPSTQASSTAPPRQPAQTAARVDVDSTEKAALSDARKLAQDKLAASFTEYFTRGRDFYSKATPGSEGNQANLASALNEFIHCEALYLRMEEEKLLTPEIEAQQQQASMLRYACMKMTILSSH